MVKEGFKECKSESLGFVIQIPKNWVCGEDEIGEEENEHFTFINKTIESGTYELRFISGGGGASIYTDDDEVESIYKSDLVYLMYVPETNWDCIGEGQIYTNGKYNPVFHVCNVAKLTDTDKEILKEVMGSIKIIK